MPTIFVLPGDIRVFLGSSDPNPPHVHIRLHNNEELDFAIETGLPIHEDRKHILTRKQKEEIREWILLNKKELLYMAETRDMSHKDNLK